MKKKIIQRLLGLKAVVYLVPAVTVLVAVVYTTSHLELPFFEMPTAQAATMEETDGDGESSDAQTQKGSFDVADGSYQGSAYGYAGLITVQVQVASSQITDIEITDVEADDDAFFNRAKAVVDEILDQQTLDVDVVSGATYSSNGIIHAVDNALYGTEYGEETAADSQDPVGTTELETVEESGTYADGTYYGSGTGFGGTTTVKVVISGGQITSIDIVSHNDDEPYITNAQALIANIISGQTTNVDTVSGATYSSVGIITAVRNALSQATTSTDSSSTSDGSSSTTSSTDSSTSATPSVTGTIPYKDGVYSGSGEGYKSDISVAVTIKDKTITSVKVTSQDDDKAYFSRAMGVIAKVITNQTTDVDVVSGATYSSHGILDAIEDALANAEAATTGVARTDTQSEETSTADTTVTETSESSLYNNGTYVGTAICYPDEDEDFTAYTFTVSVTIQDDAITGVDSAAEYNLKTGASQTSNRAYIRSAMSVLPGEITGTTLPLSSDWSVDVVSGATCTSKAIMEAVQDAVAQAEK